MLCHQATASLKGVTSIHSWYFRIALAAAICLISTESGAQYMIDDQEIRNRALSELNYSMDRGSLKEWSQKEGITGTYVFEITLRGKGHIASVRILERITGSIDHQNKVKDHLMDYKFDIPVHKKQIIRLEYRFEFLPN